MAMSAAQLLTFKTAIQANAGSYNVADLGSVSNWFNASSGTGFYWRANISTAELNTAIVWSEFALLSALLQNTYAAMISSGFVDATSTNIRNGFSTVFVGVSLTNLAALAKRIPTRLEALFTTSNLCSAAGLSASNTDVAAALAS